MAPCIFPHWTDIQRKIKSNAHFTHPQQAVHNEEPRSLCWTCNKGLSFFILDLLISHWMERMLTETTAEPDATGSVEEIAMNPWEINSYLAPGVLERERVTTYQCEALDKHEI